MSYWHNILGLLQLLDGYSEQAVRSVQNMRDVAIMGNQSDALDGAKMDAAVRDLRSSVRNMERLIPTIESLTEAARRLSSNDPSKQGVWPDHQS